MTTRRPHRRRSSVTSSHVGSLRIEALEQRLHLALTAADVEQILAAAASQARPKQAIVVSDREGIVLGIFTTGAATGLTVSKALARARTAAFFQSRENAFTTRTARFIIQDHFPHPVPNTPGGPLYGVEFSSIFGTDVLRPEQQAQLTAVGGLPLNISGDPGGIPLYKDGDPVGGIGVAGDGNDILVRSDFAGIPAFDVDNPSGRAFNGAEENDFDEAVALAGARDFMAPRTIRADRIFLDGLRLPFTKDQPATARPDRTLSELITSGAGRLRAFAGVKTTTAPIASPTPPWRGATFAGIRGELKNTAVPGFGIVGSNDAAAEILTTGDVRRVITDAVTRALRTRAAIREPIGVPARVHVAVVDRDGDILGVFRMDDGTNFSYDVAVQKARTAAYFSGGDRTPNTRAFSTRAVGFVSQRFFPIGIDDGRFGPFYMVQNELSLSGNVNFGPTLSNGAKNPLRNGITIFPGGVPLYKNGVLVGAVGISGDGVDQDDIIAHAGHFRFQPPLRIRSDALTDRQVQSFLQTTLTALDRDFTITDPQIAATRARLTDGLDGVQMPYVKFPRNPDV